MKKIKFALVFFFLVIFALGTSAQTKSNVFKTNLFSPIVKTFWLSYEHLFSESTGAQLGCYYTGINVGDTHFNGFAISPEVRFYLSESPAPKGIYLAPGLRYTNFSLSDDVSGDEGTYNAFGAALVVGAQTLLKDIITLEAYLGPAYSIGSLKVDSGTDENFDLGTFDGFGFRIGITIGIAF
jgi:hypothetical protein